MRSCRPTPWRRPALAAAAVMAVATGIGVAMHHHAPAAPRATPTKIVKSTPLPLTPPSAAATALPMNILQTFGGVRNEGIVGTTPDGDPVRRIRRKTVRQVVVIDPRTGQHLTVTVPHEEVFLVRIRAF